MLVLAAEIANVLDDVLARGRSERTIRADARAEDIVIMGAMLAKPLPNVADWDRVARRQMKIYLDGLRYRSRAARTGET